MTTSPQMAARLSRRCSKQHPHEPLLGGRAKAAELYPDKLILEILRGVRDTAAAEEEVPNPLNCGDLPGALSQNVGLFHDVSPSVAFTLALSPSQQDRSQQRKARTTELKHVDGTVQTIPLHAHFRAQYRDEYTDEPLPREWVEEAIHEEISYFNDRVWKAVPEHEALKEPGAKIIGTRWVISNKNDANDPDIRARLVAQEVSHFEDVSCYAATPPLEAKRVLSPRGQANG